MTQHLKLVLSPINSTVLVFCNLKPPYKLQQSQKLKWDEVCASANCTSNNHILVSVQIDQMSQYIVLSSTMQWSWTVVSIPHYYYFFTLKSGITVIKQHLNLNKMIYMTV